MKILIPTCRSLEDISTMIEEVKRNSPECDVIASCMTWSAARNRNFCLGYVDIGEIAIMIDDDIQGFYPDWIDDLTKPFHDESVVMVSARLMNLEGGFGPTCSRCYEETPEEIEIKSNGECVLPTAAIAFRHRGHCFDEHFLGSGFEDSDWCQQYLQADPSCKFIQSNLCKLIHLNEMKSQGKYWKHNHAYYWNKWRPNRVTA